MFFPFLLFSLFSTAKALTGDSTCSPGPMCISATVNDSTVEYVLSSTGRLTLGWMAMGFGQQMANSPMVIMWSNSDGSITLSQRQASGHVEPSVVSSPSRVATLSGSLSSTSGNAKFGFTMNANGDTRENIIWAFGTVNPGSSAVDANLQEHASSGVVSLDLSKSISSSSSAAGSTPTSGASTPNSGSSTSGATDDIPYLPYQRYIIAHAVFCGVGFLIFLPAGVLLARYVRTVTPKWYTGHWMINFGLTGPTVIIGVALGFGAVHQAGAFHLDDDHKRWGLGIFLLYLFQCALGAFIHFVKFRQFNNTRAPQNYLHAAVGLLLLALAFKQVQNGYKEEWNGQSGLEPVANGLNVVFWIWLGLLIALYIAGLALLPKQFRQEAEGRRRKMYGEEVEEINMRAPYKD